MYKILILEDDSALAGAMKKHIQSWNFEVACIRNFENIIPEFIEYDPHIVLIDIMLPFFNGYHWCTEIRKISNVPIVFISSASSNMNIVMAMNMGGDDFIEKPFDLNVITAKVRAMFRRAYAYQGTMNAMEHNGVILNLLDATITFGEERLELTKNEFKILEILLEHSGKIVAREDIMKRLWETDSYVDDNTLTVNVTRLRKKLEQVGLKDYIRTKKGVGYMVE